MEWFMTPPDVRKSIGLIKFEGFEIDGKIITPSEILIRGNQRKYNLELNPYNLDEPDIEDPQGKYKSPLRHKL